MQSAASSTGEPRNRSYPGKSPIVAEYKKKLTTLEIDLDRITSTAQLISVVTKEIKSIPSSLEGALKHNAKTIIASVLAARLAESDMEAQGFTEKLFELKLSAPPGTASKLRDQALVIFNLIKGF